MAISDYQIKKTICDTLGLKVDTVARIIIDLRVGHPITIHVQLYGDERLFDVPWASIVGARVTIVDKADG